jgi:hypothetical protein
MKLSELISECPYYEQPKTVADWYMDPRCPYCEGWVDLLELEVVPDGTIHTSGD